MTNGIPDPFNWYCDACFNRSDLTYIERTDGWYCADCEPRNKREPDTLLELFAFVVRQYTASQAHAGSEDIVARALSAAAYEKALKLSPFSHVSIVEAWQMLSETSQ